MRTGNEKCLKINFLVYSWIQKNIIIVNCRRKHTNSAYIFLFIILAKYKWEKNRLKNSYLYTKQCKKDYTYYT